MQIPATMTEQVENIQSLDISYRTLHDELNIVDTSKDRSITVPYDSLCARYRDILDNIVLYIDLDDNAREMYMYQPKKVSEELYGTTELWHEILILNDAVSVIDFRPKRLYFYDPDKFKAYLNEIMILEADRYGYEYD